MNERIRDLKGKTLDTHFPHTWSTMDYDDVSKFAEKFAELIVRELTERLVTDTHLEYDDAVWVANYLKKHFGVE